MTAQERLLDLLVAQATEGLPDHRAADLEALLDGQTEFGAEDLELTAAEIDLAFDSEDGHEEMPEHLRRRILASARDHLPAAPSTGPSPHSSAWWTGWAAAAAILILMILAPWRSTAPLDPDALRDQLIGSAGDVIQVEWAQPESPEYSQVRGDVVWSNARQAGYMKLDGLPVNLPETAQYQLWIVDPTRDANPIDGGVFDIGVDGTAIVPIDAKLRINDPKAFAITLEQPGGVVVSDGPLLVVAAVS